jgi:hypothetical protein
LELYNVKCYTLVLGVEKTKKEEEEEIEPWAKI